MRVKNLIFLTGMISLLPLSLAAQTLFDAHLHYSAADAARFTPAQIIEILDRNRVSHALVSGTPASHTEALYRHAPDRILPFLSLYRSHDEKITWPQDETLPARVAQALDAGIWRGLGELHIFAEDRHRPVLRRIVELAAARQLPLQLHGDPAVIDTLYDIAPQLPVIWAHAGTHPCPSLIADYLQRYPALHVDLSVRDARIAPQGELDPEWRELFEAYPERFMVGVDTFSVQRWENFDEVVSQIRNWLAQLPPAVAEQLARGNAHRLLHRGYAHE